MSLSVADFPTFFEAVHRQQPFVWQRELAERVCSPAGWPAALDVPTGLGKTAVLDVAVFALALQAGLSAGERTAPTRTFLVVDRRVIVDQAYERALQLERAMASDDEILVEVAGRLQLLAGPGAKPLTAARMRGGVSWSHRWLASPRLPALVTGTVDQLGSRLLFRGYGVTQTMRPVDAALCGTDSVLLLDEAHLSQPFLRTVRAVSRYESTASDQVLASRPLRTVLLSATLPRPTDGSLSDVLRCDPERETALAARARLDAVKSTALLDVKAKGELAPVLAGLAVAGNDRGVQRVGVVCNTVSLARAVFDRLGDAGLSDDVDRALLIGRCREIERDRNAELWVRGRLAAVEERMDDRPVVVVATQTIEVGADLDLDLLITEACPLDALTQRLGRLNRLGRTPSAQAIVVRDAVLHGEDAAVYGAATARTWSWLVEQLLEDGHVLAAVAASKVAGALEGGPRLDLGAGGVLRGLNPDVRAGLVSEPPLAPVVLGPVLDLWARTSPEPDPDQPVAPFLHGLQQPRAEILFCWRAGLTGPEQWEAELDTSPPAAHETVAVPYAEALRVLGRARQAPVMSDNEGGGPADDDFVEDFDESPTLEGYVVAPDQSRSPLEARMPLRPGSTVVLASAAGGHDTWGWTGSLDGSQVEDVADLSPTGPRRLRLRPEVWPVPGLARQAWPESDSDDRQGELGELLAALRSMVERGTRRGDHLHAVLDAPHLVRWNPAGPVLTAARTRDVVIERSDGTDRTPAASSDSRVTIGLERHLRDVEQLAGEVATALELTDQLVETVALAGLAHDLGKADERFQLLLHGGQRYRLELGAEPIAKSDGTVLSWKERRRIQLATGWPVGMRHEAISAALLAELAHDEPARFGHVDLDLLLHLVSTHHGYGRALLPSACDERPVSVTALLPGGSHGEQVPVSVNSADAVLDWEQPERFARLTQRYGRWGLALLETVLRLADMSVSEGYDSEPVPV